MGKLAKFRVWDKDLCKYVTGAEFGLARMSVKPDEDDGHIFSFSTLFPGRYTWEQFTGLFGKNGVPIYEGDIVNVYDFDRKSLRDVYKYTTDICWNNRSAMFWTSYADSLYDETTEDYYEVIGNIHENPELLNKEEKK